MYICRVSSGFQMVFAATLHQKVCPWKGGKTINTRMDHLFVLNAQSCLIISQILLDTWKFANIRNHQFTNVHTVPKNSYLSLEEAFKNILLIELCWLWVFPWIKLSWHSCSMWDKPGWLNWFWQFLCERLSSFNLKGF